MSNPIKKAINKTWEERKMWWDFFGGLPLLLNYTKPQYGGGQHGGAGAGSLFVQTTPEYELVKDTLWVPIQESYNEAFTNARKKGLKTFMFNGELKNTELGNDPKAQEAGSKRFQNVGLVPIERTKKIIPKKDNSENSVKKHQKGGETYTKEQEAVRRALVSKEPASNYSDAIDMDIWKPREVVTDWVQRLGNFFGVHAKTGLSNCTLTASQWVNPDKPIGRAASIVTDPGKHQFSQIPEEYAIPGTLVIASKDPAQYKDGVDNVYHTMLLTGFADKDYDFSYGGKDYKIKKGEPLVDYSRGQNMASELKRSIPLSVYNDQGEGKTFNRFYKPRDNRIAQAFLPEVIVKPK